MLRHVLQSVDGDIRFWPDIDWNIPAWFHTTAAKNYMPDNRQAVNNATVEKLPGFQEV